MCSQWVPHPKKKKKKKKNPSLALLEQVSYEAESCGTDLTLALYYDSPEQWASVYKSDLSCEERVDKAKAIGATIRLDRTLGTCSYFQTLKRCRSV